jgi:hypothetical protein
VEKKRHDVENAEDADQAKRAGRTDLQRERRLVEGAINWAMKPGHGEQIWQLDPPTGYLVGLRGGQL